MKIKLIITNKELLLSFFRKSKIEYYGNVDTEILCNNKKFWSSIKPLFSGKIASKDDIILIEKDKSTEQDEIREDKQMVAESLNDCFCDVINNLNLPH